ncbi:ABC transporter substrate-binding protein [Neobacillus vireti]|uniref:ABC transporter substrate-binding protein n=1 Tax=Neobacillus vireti LMG 21834 TaxID=1131730 RepID=A0AB94IKG0_9BACI|nr:extracellular solute-binding protein [Neobacillus vireti]ETI67520.1 ABC transporter substrate-binding protein [Neobacillus vireti LMG 21834]
MLKNKVKVQERKKSTIILPKKGAVHLMKKWLSILFAAVLILSLFAGCSNSEKSTSSKDKKSDNKTAQKVEGKLTIWTFFGQVKDMAAEFEKKYPDAKVEVKIFPGDQYQTKLLNVLQSGKGVPDIFDLERGYIDKFINSKYVVNLSDMGAEDLVKDYVPYVQALGRDAKGDVRAISDHSSPGGFWYIKENAKKYLGTDNPDEISAMVDSYDKIIELGKKVNKESNGKVHLISHFGDIYNIEAYNTKPWVKDGKLTIDPAWKENYKVQQEIFNNDVDAKLEFFSAGWGNAINDGSVVLTAMPAWASFMVDNKDDKAKDKFGVAATPKGFYMGGTYRSIYEKSENKDLAYKFIEFIAGKEWQQHNLEATGNMPGLLTVYKDNLETFKSPMFGDQNILKPYYETVKDIPGLKPDKYGEEVLSKWRKVAGQGIKDKDDINNVIEKFKKEVKNTFPELNVD